MSSRFMSRWMWYALFFLLCACFIAYALYLEHVKGLEPCNLCIFQRLAMMAFGVVCLLAALHNPQGWQARIYAFLGVVTAGLGAAIASRQVWLQSLPPDQVPECGPGLNYMMDLFPLKKVVEMVLTGSGECAEVQWRFLGLSIAGWTTIIFIGFALFCLVFLFTRRGLTAKTR